MAALLDIPRELRDHIIGLAVLSGRPAPIGSSIIHDASGLTRAQIIEVYFASRNEIKRSHDALERNPGRGRSYALDLMLAKEEVLRPTWILVPAYTKHVDSVDVTVRIAGAMSALPAYHKCNRWHSMFGGGGGGPPGVVWLFYNALERFLKAGPVGRTLDPEAGRV
ncbi:hypothetical protein DL771_006782 [Monosporascus sp. 5C6A]|nr:hypothetical protein DL771_006782 [Monosporascus sp. 5C6A]